MIAKLLYAGLSAFMLAVLITRFRKRRRGGVARERDDRDADRAAREDRWAGEGGAYDAPR